MSALLEACAGRPHLALDARVEIELDPGQALVVAEGEALLFAQRREGGRRVPLGSRMGGEWAACNESGVRVFATGLGQGSVIPLPAAELESILGRLAPEGAGVRGEAEALARKAADAVEAEEAQLLKRVQGQRASWALLPSRMTAVLRGLFRAQEEVLAVDPALSPALRACRHAAIASGVPLEAIPRSIPAEPGRERAEAFAIAARIGCRRVALEDGWWRADLGPLLASDGSGREVVLVHSREYKAYTYVEGGVAGPAAVDAAFAATINPTAFQFSVALPAGPLGVRDLLRFMLGASAHDLLGACGYSALASLLALAVPAAIAVLVGSIIPSGVGQDLVFLGVLLGAAILASMASQYVGRMHLVRAEMRATTRGSLAVLQRVLQLPLPALRRTSSGDLSGRILAVNELQETVSAAGVEAVVGGAFSLFAVVVMLFISPAAGVAMLVLLVAVAGLALTTARAQARLAADAIERGGRLGGLLLQLLRGIEKLRTAAAEGAALMLWLQRFRRQRRSQFEAEVRAVALHAMMAAVPVIGAALLWWFFRDRAGEAGSSAAFMAFTAAFAAALASVLGAAIELGQIAQALPAFDRISPFLSEAPESSPDREHPGELKGAIALEGVRFAYPGAQGEAIRGVSLSIAPGECVALVGPSGGGKSTLVQLALGLRQPSAGRVTLDGRDLRRLDPPAVRRQMGVVLQRARLVPGSIAENILGGMSLPMERAWEAAEQAGAAGEISDLPMQMQTVVADGTLSGGQAQKVLIARALVSAPRYVVLDEATSALDEASQAAVGEALESMDATRLVVAHRLSTIRHADRICVVEDGRIVEEGSYEELIAQDGAFRKLAERQLAGGEPA